eukprot:TRINITY_DN1767_c4_g1_i1.p1 TRINITY_DN1767_c4_g1~~TRINITY_DN1767_c4_g1_i1.p1  ORF type:complete len:345 (+),score=57.33 TRINITY_DN1767_c4_g1_i1:69-1037(+)
MDAWDAFLSPTAQAAPVSATPPPAPAAEPLQPAPAGGLSDGLDDFFTGATPVSIPSADAGSRSPPPGASPATMDPFDPFAGPGGSPVPAAAAPGAASPTPAAPQRTEATADDLINGFMSSQGLGGGAPRKQKTTLADLRKQDDGFLMGGDRPKMASHAPNQMMQSIMNYYEVLGVAPLATADQIRASYKQKSMKLHPDRNRDQHEDDAAMYKLMTKAYETLCDPQLRSQYDMQLQMSAAQPKRSGAGNWLSHLGTAQQPGMGGMPGMGMGMGGMGGSPFPQGTSGSPMPGSSPLPGASPMHASPCASPPPQTSPNDPFAGLM